MMGPGIVGPGSFPIRDPKTRPQKQGRVHNPVGNYEIGKTRFPRGNNPFDVERPTRVNATVRTAEKDV